MSASKFQSSKIYILLSFTFLWQFTKLWFWITKATKQAKLTNRQSHFSLLSTIHHLSPDFAFKLIFCNHALVIVWIYVVQNMKGCWHRYYKFLSSLQNDKDKKFGWKKHPILPWPPLSTVLPFQVLSFADLPCK